MLCRGLGLKEIVEEVIKLKNNEQAQALSGRGDENLKLIEEELDVQIIPEDWNWYYCEPEAVKR